MKDKNGQHAWHLALRSCWSIQSRIWSITRIKNLVWTILLFKRALPNFFLFGTKESITAKIQEAYPIFHLPQHLELNQVNVQSNSVATIGQQLGKNHHWTKCLSAVFFNVDHLSSSLSKNNLNSLNCPAPKRNYAQLLLPRFLYSYNWHYYCNQIAMAHMFTSCICTNKINLPYKQCNLV